MIQNLLISALGTCKFVLQHTKHPITQAIHQFKLLNEEDLNQLMEIIKKSSPGQTLLLTMNDELLIYTAMDITCKVYLTDLGDRMEQLNAEKLKSVNTTFAEVRSTLLKGCQFVMEGMRERLEGDDAFDDRTDILDNYILAG